MVRAVTLGAGCVALLVAAAACGSSDSSTVTSSPPSSDALGRTSSGSHATGLHVASSSLGSVLVDGRGRTVYLLTSDTSNASRCNAQCLQVWSPVAPTKAQGVTGAVSSTTTTTGGRIATVGGAPLYTYVGDAAAGDVTGQGVQSYGGTWWAVSPSGKEVTTTSGTDTTTENTSPGGSGGGYGY